MPEDLAKLQETLGYQFKKLSLLENALDHRICFTANGIETRRFEHLEFLGDRVLNLCVAEILSELHPTWTPGELNKVYSHYIRNTNDQAQHGGPLYRIAKELDLESYLTLPKGMRLDKAGKRGKTKKKNEKTKEWILSDHMESLFGAIYKDTQGDIRQLSSIVKVWFENLGLLEIDHHSIASFGESQSTASHLAVGKEYGDPVYAQFLKWVSYGNLEKLEKENSFSPSDNEQLVYALLAALNNNHGNVVPYLIRRYSYSTDTISEALDDSSIDIASRRYLEDILISKLIEAFQQSELDEIDQKELFINLIKRGNVVRFESITLPITSEVLQEGFSLAVKMKNTAMACSLVKKYDVPIYFLDEVSRKKELPVGLKGFLGKHIKKQTTAIAQASVAIEKMSLGDHPNSVWRGEVIKGAARDTAEQAVSPNKKNGLA